MNSPLTEYLEALTAQGEDLPTSLDKLPSAQLKWIQNLSKVQASHSRDEKYEELLRHIERSINYACTMEPQNEEEERAFANRLYYAVLSLARVTFGEPLNKGHDTHKRWAAHLLRSAVVHRVPTLDRLIEIEELRTTLYQERIAADYNLSTRFTLDDVELHRAKAATLFNAMLELLEDQERRAIE